MKGYHGSKTKEKNRDLWQTPKFVFDHYNKRFNFTHDVAASELNHLCDEYFTVDDDALSRDWGTVNWLNPPYSETEKWIQKAIDQAVTGKVTVMLVPAATSVAWFANAMTRASEVEIITGRIGFVDCDTGLPVNNNNIGSVVFVFGTAGKSVSLIHRDSMKG